MRISRRDAHQPAPDRGVHGGAFTGGKAGAMVAVAHVAVAVQASSNPVSYAAAALHQHEVAAAHSCWGNRGHMHEIHVGSSSSGDGR